MSERSEPFLLQDTISQRLIEECPDCIKVVDLQGRLLYMNRGGQASMEIDDLNAVQLLPVQNFWSGEDRQRLCSVLDQAYRGCVGSFQGYCPTAKGRPKWWDIVATPILSMTGQVEAVLVISRDITEGKQTHDFLEESYRRLSLACQTTALGVWQWDVSSGGIDCTERCKAILGLPYDAALTYRKLVRVIHPDDQQSVQDALKRILTRNETYESEYRVLWPDGTIRRVLLRGYPYEPGPGLSTQVVGVLLDITDRKELQQRREESLAARSALRERQRLSRELHDTVYQLLYGINLIVSDAEKGLSTLEDAQQAMQRVRMLAVAGMAELRALLFELRPETFEFEGLVAALNKQVLVLQTCYQLSIEAALGVEPPLPTESKQILYRIALEALYNVVKHAHACNVYLSLTTDDRTVLLEVRDDGCGFVPEHVDLQRFGLQSMRERSSLLQGTLSVESAPECGTTVRVCVPLDEEASTTF